MLRRDFFKAFSAAAAAFYAAKSSAAAVPAPAKKLPAAKQTAPARPSTGTPEVDRILALLDQCSVVNIEKSMTIIDKACYFTVTYIYEEGRKRAPGLAEMFDQSQCRIRSVMVQSSAAVDILDLNSGLRYPTMDSARHEIVIEWVGPASACVIG